jgi:outer membrane protein
MSGDHSNCTLLVLLFVCSWGLPAQASEFDPSCKAEVLGGGELSLPNAMRSALCNNAELQSAAATVQVRAAEVGKARSEYLPSLNVTLSEVREHTSYPDGQARATTDTAATAYGTLAWRLFDFGGRHGDYRSAAEFLEAALATRDAVQQKVLGAVVQNFFDAAAARALRESKHEDELLARETLSSAQRRMGRGEGAQSDVLQATTASARAALESNRAGSAYQKALALLAYSVGLQPGTQFNVPRDVQGPEAADEKSLAAWLDEARRKHPALAAARAEIDAARAQVASERSSGLPTVDLQVDYYANGFPQQGLSTSRQRSTTVGVSISIPVFDGFMRRYRVRAAEATVRVKEANLVNTERDTLTEVVKAYSDAETAVANVRESQNLLESAASSQVSSKRRYDAGAADILELLNTQMALADARQERVRSLADWRSARLRLLATSGILSNDALDP